MTDGDDLPSTVLVFGGNAKRFHEPVAAPEGLRPRCTAIGRNPLLRDRTLIESHYQPCSRCFPAAADDDVDTGAVDGASVSADGSDDEETDTMLTEGA